MAAVFTFPMRNDLPQYTFTDTMSGTIFQFQLLFNVRMNRWIININDASGNQILSGIPVLITRNLTGQYATLEIPEGVFIARDDTGQQTQPTQFSFGVDHTLFYVDPSVGT
jgi:hypothetical protein